jgi:hypothetical protein
VAADCRPVSGRRKAAAPSTSGNRPWSENDINHWVGDLRQKVSDDKQKWVDEFGKNMIALTHGLGDGLVTVESTRLPGVPHRTVDGTHLSMIRNISSDSRRMPPAVPIIAEQLKRQGK